MNHLHDKLALRFLEQTKIDTERIEELVAELVSDDVAALMVAQAAIRERNKMNEKPKPIWQSTKFWINNILLIISLLQLFIDSPVSNEKSEKYAYAVIRMMKMVVKILSEEKIAKVLLQLLKDE